MDILKLIRCVRLNQVQGIVPISVRPAMQFKSCWNVAGQSSPMVTAVLR